MATNETCQTCTYYINGIDNTSVCSYPAVIDILRVTASSHCPNWHMSIAAAIQAERALATEARAIANKLMGN